MQIFIFLALLFPFFSLAEQGGDGDHVGNGGGFAEMFTLSADRMIPSLLHSCMDRPDVCRLPDGTKPLEEFLKALPLLQKTSFSFSPKCEAKIRFFPDAVEIPSCLLYSEEGKSYSGSDLFIFALRARVLQGKFSEKLVDSLKEIIKRTQQESSSRSSSLEKGDLQIHYFRFENWMVNLGQFVFLESPKNSHDISEEIQSKLSCESKNFSYQLVLEGEQRLAPNLTVFIGNIYWNCDRSKFQAKIKIQGGLSFDSEVDKKSIRIQLTRKEQVW
jgi:hypothetical protein